MCFPPSSSVSEVLHNCMKHGQHVQTNTNISRAHLRLPPLSVCKSLPLYSYFLVSPLLCMQAGRHQGSCTVSAKWPLLQGSCIWLCLSSILCVNVCLCVWISCWLTVLCRCNADAAVLLHANTGFLLCNFKFRADRQVNVAAGRKWQNKSRVTALICWKFLEIKSNLQLL